MDLKPPDREEVPRLSPCAVWGTCVLRTGHLLKLGPPLGAALRGQARSGQCEEQPQTQGAFRLGFGLLGVSPSPQLVTFEE